MTEGYEAKVRPEKVEAVNAIREELNGSNIAVITEYRGLSVEDLKTLRVRLIDTETNYRVTKNTLARRAANELGLDLEELLVGPTAVAYVKGDPIAAAKVIATFAREHPDLVIKGAVMDGRILSDQEAKALATVDPLEVSLAKIMGLLTAPLQQIMMLLEAPTARIIFVLEELAKRAPADAAHAEAEPAAGSDTSAEAAPAEEPAAEALAEEVQPAEVTSEGEGE